jgi:hypothetical protein
VEQVRNYIVIATTVIVFAGLYLFGLLQDRMRAKAGGLRFSLLFVIRCFMTVEAYLSILLLLLMIALVFGMIALDRRGFF